MDDTRNRLVELFGASSMLDGRRERRRRMVLTDYYEHLDGPEPAGGLSLAAEDIRFVLALPGRQVEGDGIGDLAGYIAGRDAKGRRHNVLHRAVDGPVEFVYGVVTEHGVPTGAFIGAARVTESGRMDRYVSYFDPQFRLTE
jgi:hypothetical protein